GWGESSCSLPGKPSSWIGAINAVWSDIGISLGRQRLDGRVLGKPNCPAKVPGYFGDLAQSERRLVDVEDCFHFGPVIGLHLAQRDHLAHDLGVVADRL